MNLGVVQLDGIGHSYAAEDLFAVKRSCDGPILEIKYKGITIVFQCAGTSKSRRAPAYGKSCDFSFDVVAFHAKSIPFVGARVRITDDQASLKAFIGGSHHFKFSPHLKF